jgi:hypothetical protein
MILMMERWELTARNNSAGVDDKFNTAYRTLKFLRVECGGLHKLHEPQEYAYESSWPDTIYGEASKKPARRKRKSDSEVMQVRTLESSIRGDSQ